jgi:hypothetical protein
MKTAEPKPLTAEAKRALLKTRDALREIQPLAKPKEFQRWDQFITNSLEASSAPPRLFGSLRSCQEFVTRLQLRESMRRQKAKK